MDFERRRRYPRIPANQSVLATKLGDHHAEGFVKTKVIGLGGCMFMADESLGVGSFLDLVISVKSTAVKALVKVVYEKRMSPKEYEIGVEFLVISDEDRRIIETLWCDKSCQRTCCN